MALFSRIYFNAVFGALGGLFGWMLYGVVGDKNPSRGFEQDVQLFLGGAIIGGMIGFFVVSVDAIRDHSFPRFARLASYGVILGALGGIPGMWLGERANFFIAEALGRHLIYTMPARGLGLSLLGLAIGMSEGIAARSLRKYSYGTLGGLFGGFVGGCLFELLYAPAADALSTSYLGSAIALVILGACIGSLSALVQGVFQPASVKVLRGWQEGREYPLDKPASLLGRDEHADIALFRDMKVEKQHAYIRRMGERFLLINNHAPPDQTRVNDVPVAQAQDLHDGDRIQLGNVVLRFQARAAVNRHRTRRPLPANGIIISRQR